MKCPHCDAPLDAQMSVPSNASRKVVIEIDEEMLPVLSGVLDTAAMRYGMHGYGTLANMLNAFGEPLRAQMDPRLRGFEEGPWAQALYAHDEGYEMVFVIPEGEREVVIGCYMGPDDEKGRVLAKSWVRKDDDPRDVLAFVEDFFARRTPKPRAKAEPETDSPKV